MIKSDVSDYVLKKQSIFIKGISIQQTTTTIIGLALSA